MTVRNARTPVALAFEVLWSFAAAAVFVRVVSGGDGPAPSFAAIAVVVVGAFAVARVLRSAALPESWARAAAIGVSVVVLYAILHSEYAGGQAPWRFGWAADLTMDAPSVLTGHHYVIAGTIAAMLLWLRGLDRWAEPLEFGDALSVATLGFAAIALVALVDPPVHGPRAFGVLAIALFVAGWCLLALYQTANADEPLPAFATRWGAMLGIVIGVAAGFALLVSLFDPGTLGFLEPVGHAAAQGLVFVLAWTVGPLIGGIAYLFGLIPHHPLMQQHDVQPPAQPPPKPGNGDTPLWFEILGYVAAGAGLLIVISAFAAAVWLAMRRLTRRKPKVDEKRRGVERENTLSEDLAGLLDGIARRFRRAPPASAVEIRRLYHQMLARAEDDGIPRPAAATPTQFAPRLDARYGSGVPSEISRAFVASRYGLDAIDAQTTADLRARWRSLAESDR